MFDPRQILRAHHADPDGDVFIIEGLNLEVALVAFQYNRASDACFKIFEILVQNGRIVFVHSSQYFPPGWRVTILRTMWPLSFQTMTVAGCSIIPSRSDKSTNKGLTQIDTLPFQTPRIRGVMILFNPKIHRFRPATAVFLKLVALSLIKARSPSAFFDDQAFLNQRIQSADQTGFSYTRGFFQIPARIVKVAIHQAKNVLFVRA